MEQWFAFHAYNSDTRYGYGTEAEAEAYASHLNQGREVNLYAPRAISHDSAATLRLVDRSDTVNLDDELASLAGIR